MILIKALLVPNERVNFDRVMSFVLPQLYHLAIDDTGIRRLSEVILNQYRELRQNPNW